MGSSLSVKAAGKTMNCIISSITGELITKGTTFQLFFLITSGILAYFAFYMARHGKTWEIRPLEGLEAIYEGIGRAAEMGRPILLLPGISTLSNAQTIAGLTVYGEVAQRSAEIGVPTHLITSATEVVTAAEAITRDVYIRAGKPELYQPGKFVKWYGADQFVYAVGTSGHILQMKPATTIYYGYFLSDVIVTGETGSRVGSLQIGATTDQSATPLMAIVCDYQLVGEEMYAAAASITKDRNAVATLAGEDWIKLILLALMIIGTLGSLAGWNFIYQIMGV
jgi:hypothetical protein